MKVNIIIVGAFNYCNQDVNIDMLNNYKKWNNPLQACHNDIENLVSSLQDIGFKKIRVICIDPLYPFNKTDICTKHIHYINEHFRVGDTDFLSKSGHNIIIEFANLLDEYFPSKDNCQADCMKLYNDYKVSIVSCGCAWQKRFPMELIMKLITEDVYTPTDVSDKYSYLYAKEFNELYDEPLFQPFCQGLYETLGSLMWRGCRDNNYKYEDVLHNVFTFIDRTKTSFPEDVQDDLSRFIKYEVHWNQLQHSTRRYLNEYIYGKNIIIS